VVDMTFSSRTKVEVFELFSFHDVSLPVTS
jgi:hypothetical protein